MDVRRKGSDPSVANHLSVVAPSTPHGPPHKTRPQHALTTRPVRGLLFDMCNVFYDVTLWRHWVWQLLSHFDIEADYRDFFYLWDHNYRDAVHRGHRNFDEAFASLLRSLGIAPGEIIEIEAAVRARRRHLDETARPLPGVCDTLRNLDQAGFALGSICNSEHTADALRQRLQRFGVAKIFSSVVSSSDVGHVMPDPQSYHAALRAMGLHQPGSPLCPAEVAFIGHDRAELIGAARIGMVTIAINFDTDATADSYLMRFDQLTNVVGRPLPLAATA